MLTSTERLYAIQRLGRALADPTRCRMLLALLDGPAYPAQLAEQLSLTRQNVSNHLACLRECGLVATVAQGRKVSYQLIDDSLAHALNDLLRVMWGVAEEHEFPEDTGRRPVEAVVTGPLHTPTGRSAPPERARSERARSEAAVDS